MNTDFIERIFISELGRDDMLGRNERTIRTWVRDARKMFDAVGSVPEGYLPVELWPEHEEGGRRRVFWSHDQVQGLRAFAEEKDSQKGWDKKPCVACGMAKTSKVHLGPEKGGTCVWQGVTASKP